MVINHGFSRRRRGGACAASFTVFEADLLRSLAAQIVELLRSEEAGPGAGDPLERLLDFSGPTDEPEDPVLARLLPAGYRDDEEAAAEFRRFTESELRNGKVVTAMSVIETLEAAGLPDAPEQLAPATLERVEVELDEGTATSWLRCFTDVRLALATRLGVEEGDEDYWDSLPEEDPRGQVHQIYQWVGFLQETLVESLT